MRRALCFCPKGRPEIPYKRKLKIEQIQNEFFYYVECLKIVVGDAVYQRKIMGDTTPACAWELKADLMSHTEWLVNNSSLVFSALEINKIKDIQSLVQTIDTDDKLGMESLQWKGLKSPVNTYLEQHKDRICEIYRKLELDIDWINNFS